MLSIKNGKIILLFIGWYLGKLCFNITNKQLLKTDKSFIFISLLQYFVAFICLSVILKKVYGINVYDKMVKVCSLNVKHKIIYKYLLIISLGDIMGVVLLNLSLKMGNISCSHMIKSLEPIWAVIINFICFNNKFNVSMYLFLSILVIVFGISLSVYNNPNCYMSSVIVIIIAGFGTQIRSSFIKYITVNLPKPNIFESNSKIIMLFMTGINAIILFIYSIIFKKNELKKISFSFQMIELCLFYFTYTFSSINIIQLLSSPIIHSIGAVFSRLFVIMGSILLYEQNLDKLNIHNIIGIYIAFIGLILFISLTKNKIKMVIKPIIYIIIIGIIIVLYNYINLFINVDKITNNDRLQNIYLSLMNLVSRK